MRLVLSTLLLVTLPSWSYSSSTHDDHNILQSNKKGTTIVQKSHRETFDKWLKEHNKSYSSSSNDTPPQSKRQQQQQQQQDSVEEYERRLEIFVANTKKVARHNEAFQKGYTSYAMTVSESPFADLTDEEFRSVYLMEEQNCSATHRSSALSSSSASALLLLENSGPLPKSIDWRTKGVLTPIKNQKQCGSCWTFSTTGTLEAHTCIHDNTIDCTTWSGLSEQQLLDCSSAYDNHGCNGGLPSHAFEYIKEMGGDWNRNVTIRTVLPMLDRVLWRRPRVRMGWWRRFIILPRGMKVISLMRLRMLDR